MNKIVYLMGKSASGKDTIYRGLRREYPEFSDIVLYTTRPPRRGEMDGREYYFISEEQVSKFMDEGRIIELRAYNTVHGIWKYLTVDDGQIDLSKKSYLVIGTLESYRKMKDYYGADALLPIYIEVEDGLRLTRAIEREKEQEKPGYEEMCRRFLADARDFSAEKLKEAEIDKIFQNNNLEDCVMEIKLYLKEKLCYTDK